MDDTKQNEAAYSSARTETAAVGSPPEVTKAAESSGTKNSGHSLKQTQKAQMTTLFQTASTSAYQSLADFAEFLKRTRRIWLMVAGAVFGLMVMVILVKDTIQWATERRERRQEQAIASVTPDRLIARCGQPAQDMTKEVYPILMRTMSYQPRGSEKLVVAFSRTAEEKSDWVFLSMKDEIETMTYDTPEAKIAALPCLDSKK
jgi:hypothetical protein